jgi:hypothetical protein
LSVSHTRTDRRELRPEPFPEGHGKVLGRRDAPCQPRHIGIQVAVIHVLDDLPADDVRKPFQVKDITAGIINLAGHDDFQDVVVAMQVRAFTEQAPVLVV